MSVLTEQHLNMPIDGGDSRLKSRRVPDLTRLYALEDARVARWKRQHKVVVTVPLGFRLTPVPPEVAVTPSDVAIVDTHSASVKGVAAKGQFGEHKDGAQGRSAGPPSSAIFSPRASAPRSSKADSSEPSGAEEQDTVGRVQDDRPWEAHSSRGAQQEQQERRRRPATADPDGRPGVVESGQRQRQVMRDVDEYGRVADVRPATANDAAGREDLEQLKKRLQSIQTPMQLKRIEDPLIFYRLSKTLGEGAYGKVKLAYHLLVREKVAVKIFERAKIQEPHAKKRVAREIRILKALDHPNIIRLYEEVDTPQRKFLMMQFVSGGDLCRYVREKRRLDESEACQLFVQIVNGLEYCHRSGIVHRDIKLDNLLIDEHKNIKIVDFGFSVSFKEGQQLRKACGSPSYAAPEIVSRKPYYPTAIDVWSLGVVLYAMVAGYFPFQATDAKELCSKICKGKFTCPDFMSKECQSLVESMLTVEPEKRTSLYKTRGHTWCKAAFERAGPAPVVQRPIDSERSQDSMMPPTTAVAVDPAVVNKLTGFGLDHTLVTQCVQHRMHNLVCTCYDLLVARQEKTRQRAASGHPAASPAPSAAASAATTAAPETPTPPACRMMV